MFKEINDLLDRIPLWKRLQGIAGRQDALEARIAVLEDRLKVTVHPGEICAACGTAHMRRIAVKEMQDVGPNAWREEMWQCQLCAAEDHRIKRL